MYCDPDTFFRHRTNQHPLPCQRPLNRPAETDDAEADNTGRLL
jgi:hypothetical protein